MTDDRQYFEYLQRRSRIGLLYRRFWLYPTLCSFLHGRVLDIGCGIGDMLRYRSGTVGVDVNPRTVAWCREHGLDARTMEPNRLPFETAEFDGAILDNVLEHLAAPDALLRDTHRVLRPGGVVIAGVPGTRGYESDPDHKTFYDADSLGAVMEAAGFQRRRVIRMPLPMSWMDRYVRQYCIYGVFRRA